MITTLEHDINKYAGVFTHFLLCHCRNMEVCTGSRSPRLRATLSRKSYCGKQSLTHPLSPFRTPPSSSPSSFGALLTYLLGPFLISSVLFTPFSHHPHLSLPLSLSLSLPASLSLSLSFSLYFSSLQVLSLAAVID